MKLSIITCSQKIFTKKKRKKMKKVGSLREAEKFLKEKTGAFQKCF